MMEHCLTATSLSVTATACTADLQEVRKDVAAYTHIYRVTMAYNNGQIYRIEVRMYMYR